MRDIFIEEMPQGCVLYDGVRNQIVISSREDAEAVIESLQRMIIVLENMQDDEE